MKNIVLVNGGFVDGSGWEGASAPFGGDVSLEEAKCRREFRLVEQQKVIHGQKDRRCKRAANRA